MTEVNVVELKPLFETQLGSWLYQTQLCPIFMHKRSDDCVREEGMDFSYRA